MSTLRHGPLQARRRAGLKCFAPGEEKNLPTLHRKAGFRIPPYPPKQYNPNLLPIGHGFGFVVSIEEIEDR